MMSDRATVVAVIGGGASGTLAAIYLLREAAAARVPLRIAMIDRTGGTGSVRYTPPLTPPTC